jgi:hypothetical protein
VRLLKTGLEPTSGLCGKGQPRTKLKPSKVQRMPIPGLTWCGCVFATSGILPSPLQSLPHRNHANLKEPNSTRYASHRMYACPGFRYLSLPGHWTEQRKIVHLLEYFGDCQIGLQSCPDSDPLRKSYTAFSTWRNRWSILPLNTIRAALPVGLYSPRVPGSPSL